MKRKLIRPTEAEDAAITAAARTDADNPPLGDAELRQFKRAVGKRGPQKAPRKISTTIRLSPEVVDFYKSRFDRWQSRIDADLRTLVKSSSKRLAAGGRARGDS